MDLMNLKKSIDEVGLSGEEFEMLVSFAPEHYSEVMQIAEETNTPLTVYAKVAKNKCVIRVKVIISSSSEAVSYFAI